MSSIRRCSNLSLRYFSSSPCIGILREIKNTWERRTPLVPEDVKALCSQGIQVLVQPCSRRIFSNEEYQKNGAIIREDISDASTILSVKEIPPDLVLPNKTYVMFAHVIKGQQDGMPLLDEIIKKKSTLLDYECIKENGTGQRVVAFGKYAGIAGMIDGFRGIGESLLSQGISSPFLQIGSSYMYNSVEEAYESLREIGEIIKSKGIEKTLVLGITGKGKVAKGVEKVLYHLPHEYITLEKAKELQKNPNKKSHCLYLVNLELQDLIQPIKSQSSFDKLHYYANPTQYKSKFHISTASALSVLINCMYWDQRYPRLFTQSQLNSLLSSSSSTPFPLFFLCDITCDINGAIEVVDHATTIGQPFARYNAPIEQYEWPCELSEATSHCLDILAVDNLPAELPRDASHHFSTQLSKYLSKVLLNSMDKWPIEMRNAVVVFKGDLTEKYQYINQLRKKSKKGKKTWKTQILLNGHLFDYNIINQVLDLIENEAELSFDVYDVHVKPNAKSTISIDLFSSSVPVFSTLHQKLDKMVSNFPSESECVLSIDGQQLTHSTKPKQSKSTSSLKHILVLGSGFVSGPCIEYLLKQNYRITLVSNQKRQAFQVCEQIRKRLHLSSNQLKDKVEFSMAYSITSSSSYDAVISLLPASLHPEIARLCIDAKIPLITASYVSKEMQDLHEKARDQNVILLNEIGLDPGLDHMSACQLLHQLQSQNHEVLSFSSVCGGLPSPEHAYCDNPLGYKFSWSPRGVLSAIFQDAQYLQNKEIHKIQGGLPLLTSAQPYPLMSSFNFEVIPNRDCLPYRELYNLPQVRDFYRGTLRYNGFSQQMKTLLELGLMEESAPFATTSQASWAQYLQHKHDQDISSFSERIQRTWDFLNLSSPHRLMSCPSSPMTSFVDLLQEKLRYTKHQRDMVVMNHAIKSKPPNSSSVQISTSQLICYGDPHPSGYSAMAKTVGYPVAMATDFLVRKELPNQDKQGGVFRPMAREIYHPLLERLKDEGIHFTEQTHLERDTI